MLQAFPGITSGGIVSALFDCHGSWTAALALMDQGRLSKPPLTLTKEMLVHLLLLPARKLHGLEMLALTGRCRAGAVS